MKVASLIAPLTITALAAASAPAMAYQTGDFLLRAGPALVSPGDDSDQVPGIDGSGVEADDNTQLGLTLSYMLTDNVAIELLAATPFSHTVEGNGSLDGLKVGTLKHLPPTLSVLYYPMDSSSALQPYLGIGLNYTWFYDTKIAQETEDALEYEPIGLDVDDSIGLAFKVGVDYSLNNNWGLSAGAYYIDIDTTATLEIGTTNVDVDVNVDPFVYMLGVNYKF